MSVNVAIPTALRGYADNEDVISLDGATVRDVLKKLTEKHTGLRPHLFDDNDALRNFVNVYVNDDDIRYLKQADTELSDGDEVTIVPAVAGGRPALLEETETMEKPNLEEVQLSKEEIERYSRHLIIPEFGMKGQKALKAASVLCIGTGGLGSPLAMYLAAAGIGKLGLVDFDIVDHTNLQRQIIHGTKDVGRPKLHSARDAIQDINPYVDIVLHEERISSDNALEIMEPYDLIIDGTDNFPTRYLVNDACVLLGKPNVYGSIYRFEGQSSVFWAEKGPCYRCLYPEPPPPGLVPSCAEGGVLGILPGIIGVIQANEAVKLITGLGDPLIGRLLLYDALGMKFREMKLRKDPNCPICGEHPTVTELIDYEQFCGIGGGSVSDVVELDNDATVSVMALHQEILSGGEPYILDVREPHEYEICKLEDSHLIPLGELQNRIDELDKKEDIVVLCRVGGRSATGVKILQEAGFKMVRNITGGIRAWAHDVDPDMPVY